MDCWGNRLLTANISVKIDVKWSSETSPGATMDYRLYVVGSGGKTCAAIAIPSSSGQT